MNRLTMMKDQDANILIVGAGPTGLTAALALAQKGIKPRIIDQRPTPITTSNALAIQPRTLELWEEMQLIDDALQEGHPLQGLTISTSHRVLATISLDYLPTKYPFILALPQSKTEDILTRHLSKYGIDIEREVCLQNLVERGDTVEAICNGRPSSYSWIIGCDGVNSTVRESAGISFKGQNLPQHFIMADIHIDWAKPSNQAHVIVSSKGPIAFFPLDSNGFGRLVIDFTGDGKFTEGMEPTLDDFQSLMNERSELKAILSSPSWISSFRIQSRVAESYRKGRLFLAGDAAHRHSPFGGQGLNTGVQDAIFLGNLLAKTLQSGHDDELELYEKIRRPIGEQIVHRTAMMTRIITSRSKPVQNLRNFAIPLLLSIEPLRNKVLKTLTQLIYK